MPNLNDLLQEKGKLVNDMRVLNDSVKNGEDFTPEQNDSYDRMNKDLDSVQAKIKREQQLQNLEKENAKYGSRLEKSNHKEGPKDKYQEAFWNAQRGKITTDVRNVLSTGVDANGGYIVPQEYDDMLVIKKKHFNEMRNYVNAYRASSDKNIPIEADEGVASYGTENGTYNESDATFGQKVMGAHKLNRIIKVSEELVNDSIFDIQTYIADAYGRSFGLAEEAAFINGDGTGKPEGVLVGGAVGVTAASASAVTADEIIDLFYSLGRAYRANSTAVTSDEILKILRKLKDGQGQYLWQPALTAGEPDTILGRPVISSTAVDAVGVNAKVFTFADLSFYHVADRTGRVMQRLNERYAELGQIGFKMNERHDGKLVLAEAAQVLQMAAA